MEPIRAIVTHRSDGTEEDMKVYSSMINNTRIDINAQEADRSMFTTPKTKYTNEGFVNGPHTFVPLSITAFILVILLLAFRKK